MTVPPIARQALRYKQYHELGYRFNDSARIADLTLHQRQMLDLGARAEQYIKEQARRERGQHDRPANFGDVAESRQNAFR